MSAGSGSLRVSAAAIDQLIAATTSAAAPKRSTGASAMACNPLLRSTSTATPPIPIESATASRAVILRVRKRKISESAMNAGMVASTIAALPEGTRVSAQKSRP